MRTIADAVGFHYRYEAASDQYIHSVGQVALSGDGIVSSYLPDPAVAPERLTVALAEAQRGATSSAIDRLLLLCFDSAAQSGRWSRAILASLALLNLAGALAAVLLFIRLRRRPLG